MNKILAIEISGNENQADATLNICLRNFLSDNCVEFKTTDINCNKVQRFMKQCPDTKPKRENVEVKAASATNKPEAKKDGTTKPDKTGGDTEDVSGEKTKNPGVKKEDTIAGDMTKKNQNGQGGGKNNGKNGNNKKGNKGNKGNKKADDDDEDGDKKPKNGKTNKNGGKGKDGKGKKKAEEEEEKDDDDDEEGDEDGGDEGEE